MAPRDLDKAWKEEKYKYIWYFDKGYLLFLSFLL